MKTNSKTEKGMGFWSIVLMGLGAVIGAGVVTYSGIAVGLTGRSAWIAYAVAILLGFLCNLPLILMTTAARIKGGNYSFIATTLGDLGGGYYGISRVLMVLSFSTFSLSFGNYMNIIFPAVPVKVFAYGALTLFGIINLFGTDFMAKVQNFLSVFLIVGLLIFGIYGVLNAKSDSLMITQPGYFMGGKDGFWQAVMILMASTTGYTLITSFSNNCKKPKTELPLAMCMIPLALVVIYCSVAFTMSNVLPVEETANQPLTVVAKVLFNPFVYYLFIVGGPVMALCTTLNSSYGIFERPLVQVSDDGWLPASLAVRNKYGIAWKYIVIFMLVGAIPMAAGFNIRTIVSNTTFVNSIGYILEAVAVMRYPKKMEGAWENRAWKIPMWAFLASCWTCIAIRLYMMWRSLKTANMTMIIGSVAACVLILLWCIIRQKSGKVHVTKSWELH